MSSFWRLASAFPSKGRKSFTGIRKDAWIVDAFMLNVATPVGARSTNGVSLESLGEERCYLMHAIKKVFPVPIVPCTIIRNGGVRYFFLQWFKIRLRALVWFGDNELEVVALEWDGCGRCWLERLLVMNCMAISCKLKGIIVSCQLWFLSKSRRPSMSRWFSWMSSVGWIWDSISHSSKSVGCKGWIWPSTKFSSASGRGSEGCSQHAKLCKGEKDVPS